MTDNGRKPPTMPPPPPGPRILRGCEVLPPMDDGRRRDPPAADTPDESDEPKRKATRRKAGDRFRVLNAFVDFAAGELSRAELIVWLILYRDARDGVARTSQADVARRAGCSDRTVRRTVERLRRRGLLKVTYRGGIGRGASAYRIRPIPPDLLGT